MFICFFVVVCTDAVVCAVDCVDSCDIDCWVVWMVGDDSVPFVVVISEVLAVIVVKLEGSNAERFDVVCLARVVVGSDDQLGISVAVLVCSGSNPTTVVEMYSSFSPDPVELSMAWKLQSEECRTNSRHSFPGTKCARLVWNILQSRVNFT